MTFELHSETKPTLLGANYDGFCSLHFGDRSQHKKKLQHAVHCKMFLSIDCQIYLLHSKACHFLWKDFLKGAIVHSNSEFLHFKEDGSAN